METDAHPSNQTTKPPSLSSDQLNYLIWKYLQEAGYGEAAVKLQQSWAVNAESLPFADHVERRALVQLVQKGLRYHHLLLTVDENGRQTKALQPSMFFFGPDSAKPASAIDQREALLKVPDADRGVSPAVSIATTSRGKTREPPNTTTEPPQQPQPVKRGRKSTQAGANGTRKTSAATDTEGVNGHAAHSRIPTSPSIGENALEDGPPMLNGHASEDKMDVDMDPPTSAEPNDVNMEEQMEEALPPIIPTLTNGTSQAVQVVPRKVTNLGPTSAILSLEENKTIIRATWRPAEAESLLAQGEDFCSIWNLAGHHLQPESVKPLPSKLFESNKMVTATAWYPSGALLAVATYSESEGQILLFDGEEMTLIEELPASRRIVTLLKWHPSGTRLIGIAHDDGLSARSEASSTVLVWSLGGGSGASAPLSFAFDSQTFDLDCAIHDESLHIFVAGEGAIHRFSADSDITQSPTWQSRESDSFTFVRSVQTSPTSSTTIAIAGDTGSIWIPGRGIFKRQAHIGSITAIDVRRQSTNMQYSDRTTFATSGTDGFVRVWELNDNAHELECVRELRMEHPVPIMSVAYSPDGFCLAGVSNSTARIWNAEHDYALMASWEGPENEWRGTMIKDEDVRSMGGRSSVNGENGVANIDYSLSWHLDSKMLAFGLGPQVAIIDFQR